MQSPAIRSTLFRKAETRRGRTCPRLPPCHDSKFEKLRYLSHVCGCDTVYVGAGCSLGRRHWRFQPPGTTGYTKWRPRFSLLSAPDVVLRLHLPNNVDGDSDHVAISAINMDAPQQHQTDQAVSVGPHYINRVRLNLIPSPFLGSRFIHGTLFQAVLDGEADTPTKGTGRLYLATIDPERLRTWLRECEHGHGKTCNSPEWLAPRQLHKLRVIDVPGRRIVEAPSDCRYLALSYAWGKTGRQDGGRKAARLTLSSVSALMRPNGLDALHLPRTIRDTMSLASLLGEDFLWVDALCIVQDDIDELMEQTSHMDMVYSRAILTIIAGAGEDAEVGLPGLEPGTRSSIPPPIRVNDKLSMVQSASGMAPGKLRSSKWDTRGWTFQERILSRRVLIFTEQMAYWNCETCTWDEETILKPELPESRVTNNSFGCYDVWQSGTEKFSSAALWDWVAKYNSRSFTYPGDILPAFLGILNCLQFKTKERFHWGLLSSCFGQDLAWLDGAGRRDAVCPAIPELGIHRPTRYPSWAWLAWEGTVLLSPSMKERLHLHFSEAVDSELEFYILNTDGTLREMRRPQPGLPPEPHPSVLSHVKSKTITSGWKESRTKITGRVISTVDGVRLEPVGSESLHPEKRATSEEQVKYPVSDTGRVVFWTSHARLETRLLKRSGFGLVRVSDEYFPIHTSSGLFDYGGWERRRHTWDPVPEVPEPAVVGQVADRAADGDHQRPTPDNADSFPASPFPVPPASLERDSNSTRRQFCLRPTALVFECWISSLSRDTILTSRRHLLSTSSPWNGARRNQAWPAGWVWHT